LPATSFLVRERSGQKADGTKRRAQGTGK